MLNFKEKPYKLLLFTAFALASLLVILQFVDIDFQDKTMFLIPVAIIVWLIPIYLVLFWLLYLLTKRFLYSKTITWTHVIITVLTAVFVVTILYIGINPLQPTAHRYYEISGVDRQKFIGKLSQFTLIVFVCGQCTYVVNILLGLSANTKNES